MLRWASPAFAPRGRCCAFRVVGNAPDIQAWKLSWRIERGCIDLNRLLGEGGEDGGLKEHTDDIEHHLGEFRRTGSPGHAGGIAFHADLLFKKATGIGEEGEERRRAQGSRQPAISEDGSTMFPARFRTASIKRVRNGSGARRRPAITTMLLNDAIRSA